MNGLKSIRSCRVPAFIAMLFSAIFTILLLPAYGQQEVDPTWYDPWVSPNTAVVHPQPPAVVHSSQPSATTSRDQTVRSTSQAQDAGKVRGKDAQLGQSRRNAAHKGDGTPSADSRLPGAPRRVVIEAQKAAAVLGGV